MAGYAGFSMSNNAVMAYEDGEKPKSKWTKREIIEEIKRQLEDKETELNVSLSDIEKMPVEALRELALYESSWHHTSSYYNETSFYSVDASEITESDLENWSPRKKTETEYRVKAKYVRWSGTMKHPKGTDVEEWGTIKGNWFYSDSGVKKSVNGNWFWIIESEEKKTA